jgi:uncharacterized protein (TIGR02453 family)
MASTFTGFPRALAFLEALADHNDRDWFAANKHRYESDVLEPALAFIAAMREPLARFAPNFDAVPKRVGGSLMRVYRDTRFSRDKSPYKTNIGIQFRHNGGNDVHAPGYYVHIEPGDVFIAAGLWRPEPAALAGIRDAIVERPQDWKRARDYAAFRRHYTMGGEALQRVPKGYPGDHPFADDLKRKDFIASCALSDDAIVAKSFVKEATRRFEAADAMMRFLCRAVGAPF